MPAPPEYAGQKNIRTLPREQPDRDPASLYRDTGDDWDAEFGDLVSDEVTMAR
jgi:DNA-directed RNA polymerase sigma subunit (sigma70/sigma32)